MKMPDTNQELKNEPRAPPANTVGIIGWIRQNLFGGFINSFLTLLSVYLLWIILPPLLDRS